MRKKFTLFRVNLKKVMDERCKIRRKFIGVLEKVSTGGALMVIIVGDKEKVCKLARSQIDALTLTQ